MKYLLDTNIVSAWAKRSVPALLSKMLNLSPDQLAISSLVQHELLFGLALMPQVRSAAPTREFLRSISVLPFDTACAERAATLRADLSRRGQPIGPYDLLIAATALEHDLTMVTHNTREFQKVESLRVEDWLA